MENRRYLQSSTPTEKQTESDSPSYRTNPLLSLNQQIILADQQGRHGSAGQRSLQPDEFPRYPFVNEQCRFGQNRVGTYGSAVSNKFERFSISLEHDPKSIEFCSRLSVGQAIPKPSGLGMVSCSTTSAARRDSSALHEIDARRIILRRPQCSQSLRTLLVPCWLAGGLAHICLLSCSKLLAMFGEFSLD